MPRTTAAGNVSNNDPIEEETVRMADGEQKVVNERPEVEEKARPETVTSRARGRRGR